MQRNWKRPMVRGTRRQKWYRMRCRKWCRRLQGLLVGRRINKEDPPVLGERCRSPATYLLRAVRAPQICRRTTIRGSVDLLNVLLITGQSGIDLETMPRR